MKVDEIRRDYQKNTLSENSIEKDPILQFGHWFDYATNTRILEVNAMTLATATSRGRPSARIVLLKDFDERGFVFYTSYEGRKAIELEQNPYAALVIYWKELERQVRIEGRVEKVSKIESDEYFESRPIESKMSAIVSKQSKVIQSRRHLEDLWVGFLKTNFNNNLTRPESWGGYRVVPSVIEFWQGRASRLHDRIVYSREVDHWKTARLQP
jgi:pyridoxamine 5'-phosphate oxidase